MRRKTKLYIRECGLLFVLFGLLVYYTIPKFLAAQNINDESHFPDPEFRAVVENFMNVEPGGRFSSFEAERKTGTFRLYANNVRGLHYFKSIKEFMCQQRKITKLDLSPFTNLRNIHIFDVPLAELILPKSEQLDTIYLRNTKLRQIDVSGCPNLFRFECGNSLLSSIDVTNNPKLLDLRVNSNQLSDIDLTKNLDLYTLDCSSNLLVRLDLSKNQELRNLTVNGNPFEKLNVSHLSHLSALHLDLVQMDAVERPRSNPSLQVILKSIR